jgi:hypothetical protein
LTNSASQKPTPATEKLELSLELSRTSVIYADEKFTLYFTIKNISNESLYIWYYGILGSSEFNFVTVYEETGYIEGEPPQKNIVKLKRLFSSIKDSCIRSFWDFIQLKTIYAIKKKYLEESAKSRYGEEGKPAAALRDEYDVYSDADYDAYYTQKFYTDEEIKKKLTQDTLKNYYIDLVQYEGKLPYEILPGESVTQNIFGRTKRSLFFRPDKYKLTLISDCSDSNGVFSSVTKTVEVEILASLITIIYGALIGGVAGTLVRIFQRSSPFLDLRNLFEIIGAAILSVLAVIALARKTGVQTLVTIQDFWGGIFVGFLVGYSGKAFFDTLMGLGGEGAAFSSDNLTSVASDNLTSVA